MEYGTKLSLDGFLRISRGIKETTQKVIVTHNSSKIDETSYCQNLGSDDVIVTGSTDLSFVIKLTSEVDMIRTLVSNIGKVILKNIAVNEVLSIGDYDVISCY